MPINDVGKLGYPVQPYQVGKPTMQAYGEALDRAEQHEEWHEENPGRWDCPPELCPPEDMVAMQKGQCMLDSIAGNFEAGDSIVPGKVSRR